jgi:hypothetical protein
VPWCTKELISLKAQIRIFERSKGTGDRDSDKVLTRYKKNILYGGGTEVQAIYQRRSAQQIKHGGRAWVI